MVGTIGVMTVTYDFEQHMDGAQLSRSAAMLIRLLVIVVRCQLYPDSMAP